MAAEPIASTTVEIVDAARARRGARMAAATVAIAALSTIVLFALPQTSPSFYSFPFLFVILSPLWVLPLQRGFGATTTAGASVSLSDRRLKIDFEGASVASVELSEVRAAWIEARPTGSELVVVLPDERVARVFASDSKNARRILRAIQSGRAQDAPIAAAKSARGPAIPRRAPAPFGAVPVDALETRRGSRVLLLALPVACTLAVVPRLFGATRANLPLLFALCGVLAAASLHLRSRARRRTLEIGRDGLVLGADGAETFISYARIQDVRSDDEQVVLFGTRGLETRIDVGKSSSAATLARQIKRLSGRVRKKQTEAGHLARNRRSPQAWVKALRRIVGEGDYRSARVAIGDLVRVLEAPDGPVEARVAAAVAIAASGDRAARERVRIATDAYLEPSLRRALRAALEGELDEAALVEAQRAAAPREETNAQRSGAVHVRHDPRAIEVEAKPEDA